MLIVRLAAVLVALAIILLGPLVSEQLRQLVATLPAETERQGPIEARPRWMGPSFRSFKAAINKTLAGLAELDGDRGHHHGASGAAGWRWSTSCRCC